MRRAAKATWAEGKMITGMLAAVFTGGARRLKVLLAAGCQSGWANR